MKMKLSKTQLNIIDTLENNNVTIMGCTGTGKTTTTLYACKNKKRVLYLTLYNYCENDIKDIIDKNELGKHIEVYSIYNFLEKIYGRKISSLEEIQKNIRNSIVSSEINMNYDFIIIDEAEDLNIVYYEALCKIINLNIMKKAIICLVGDSNQSLMKLNTSDYLKFGNLLFNSNNNWSHFNLKKSYTINKSNSVLVKNIIKDKLNDIEHGNKKSKIKYIVGNIWNSKLLIRKVKKYIYEYGIENIMILAPSIESKNLPIRYIIEEFEKISNIYITDKDSDKVNYQEAVNKLIILNYKQSKNIRRKIVFVLNFDISYFEETNNKNELSMDNILYIASTRATKYLTLVQDFKNKNINNLELNKIKKITKVKIEKNCSKFIKKNDSIQNLTSINTVKKIKENDNSLKNEIDTKKNILFTRNLIPMLFQEIIKEIKEVVLISEVENGKPLFSDAISFINIKTNPIIYIENISNLIKDTVIYSLQEHLENNDQKIIKNLKNVFNTKLDFIKKYRKELLRYKKFINEFNEEQIISIKNKIKFANLWNYYISGNSVKFINIEKTNFDFIDNQIITKATNLLKEKLSTNLIFNYALSKKNNFELINNQLNAFIDCIDLENNNLWSFVWEDKINSNSFVELAFISYLLYDNEKVLIDVITKFINMKLKSNNIKYDNELNNLKFSFKIFNIKTNVIYNLEIDNIKLKNIINKIFQFNYYNNNDKLRLFVENNLSIKNLYI